MTLFSNKPVVQFDASLIPAELRAADQWLLWTPHRKDDGTFTKAPVTAREPWKHCDRTDPGNWTTFDDAVAAYKKFGASQNLGGLTFACGGGIVGLDWDNCVDPETGQITDEAVADAVASLGTYAEYSPSGAGVRAFVKGALPGPNIKRDRVEMWGDHKGAGTVTGRRLAQSPATLAAAGDVLERLYAEASKSRTQSTAQSHTSSRTDSSPATMTLRDAPRTDQAADDDEVIRAATQNNQNFNALWGGDTSGQGGDDSSADQALANILAYYCGPHGAVQVEGLMRRSGLNRDKFDRPLRSGGPTYLRATIDEAYRFNAGNSFDWSRWFSRDKNKTATAIATKKKSRRKASGCTVEPSGSAACGPASLKHPSSLTEVGLGRRLALHAHGTLRYVEDSREWLGWDGKVWRRDNGLRANAVAKMMTDAMWREWMRLSEDNRKVTRSFMEKAASARGIAATTTLARNEPEIIVRAAELDAYHFLLNCENGVLDLNSATLLPHDPKYLLTQMAGTAFESGADCPRWKQFIDEVTAGVGDEQEELGAYLQRVAGLCLSGDVSEHSLVFHHGAGRNGKSVFLGTLLELLGTYATTAPSELLMTKMQRTREPEQIYASIVGKRLVTLSENDQNVRLSEAVVKQLVGGDRIVARRLYADAFEVRPTWKLQAAMNHVPAAKGTDAALWRRLHKVPWNVSFEGAREDKRLAEKLRRELPGILNWCLAGFIQWRAGGLKPPRCVLQSTQEYREANDVLGEWMAECCVIDVSASAAHADLYRSFACFCADRGEDAFASTTLGLELERRGFCRTRPTGGPLRDKIVRTGIGLQPLGGNDP
jgi:putative DNA primase/helicase